MCLEKVKVINVATKDIVCYKWFKISSEGLLSPYRDYMHSQKKRVLSGILKICLQILTTL